MGANKLRLLIGSSLEVNRLEQPDLDAVKRKFDEMVRDAARRKPVEELNGLEIAELAKANRKQGGADLLKKETATLLGLDTKATYADAFLHCKAALIRELIPA